MDLIDRLVGRHIVAGRADAVAYIDPDLGAVSYGRLHGAALRYRALLRDAGVEPGDRALVVSDDSVTAVAAVLGCWTHHCVPVLVSPLLTTPELEFIGGDCSAHFVHLDVPPEREDDLRTAFAGRPVALGEQVRRLVLDDEPADDAVQPFPADRVALVQYTSGSTGRPKGVLHGTDGIAAALAGFGALMALRHTDTVLSTAKLSFGYGFGNSLLFPLAAGARTVLLRGPVDGYVVARALARYWPTVLCAVPRVYRALLVLAEAGRVPPAGALRLAVSAGEHLPAELCTAFTETFRAPLLNGLGATEVLHIVLATRQDASEPGSTGRSVLGVVATVRDDAGDVVPDGVDGRLHIAGPIVARGYLDRPAETARTFLDGGAYTSDIVRRNTAGEFQYVCRADDMLNLGGYRVAPAEIEQVVRAAAGVADCVVVGGVDAAGLQQATAYVVPADGQDHGRVRRLVRDALRAGLAPFKHPSRIEILDSLPTTSTGKLARFRLRDLADDTARDDARAVRRVLLRDGDRTMVILPFAGGTSRAFVTLARRLGPPWRIVTGETAYRSGWSAADAAEEWWSVVRPELRPGSVLFGHSLGAALLLEVAARHQVDLTGVHVVLSAPPLRPTGLSDAVLADDATVATAKLAADGLLPDTPLAPDELRRLILPRFATDLELLQGGWSPPVPSVPVHLLLGTRDRLCQEADLAKVANWPIVAVHHVDGDHYFCVRNAAGTARVLEQIAGLRSQ